MIMVDKVEPLFNKVKKKKVRSFIADFKDEIGKVSWTARPELMKLTKVVVFSTLFFGIAVYLADLFIRNGILGVNQLIGMFFK